MTLKFIQSQSTVMPKLIDTESSKYSVYIRQNVREDIVEDEPGGEPYTLYTYDEAKLTKEEYQQYVNEKLQAENEDLRIQVDEQAEALMELASLIVDAMNL